MEDTMNTAYDCGRDDGSKDEKHAREERHMEQRRLADERLRSPQGQFEERERERQAELETERNNARAQERMRARLQEQQRQRQPQGGLARPNTLTGREEDARRDYSVAESEGLFGSSNKLVIRVTYKTSSGRELKMADIKQEDSFAAMLEQPFFVDLVNRGPLRIDSVDISSEVPDRAYHVNAKLVSTLDAAAQDLDISIIKHLNIKLKFDGDGDEAEFKAALVRAAMLLNIRYERCTYNDVDTPLFAAERKATANDGGPNDGSVGTTSAIKYEGSNVDAISTTTRTDDRSMTTSSTIRDQSGNVTAYTSNTSSCTLL
jgi:hypothetical protein